VPVLRRRGRPSNAERGRAPPLSQVERNRRYREAKRLASIDIPGGLADRLREAREERGMTTEQLLAAALDALDAAEGRKRAA
jgi:ribosome-binding protein aMBF1 (putative translation factor)